MRLKVIQDAVSEHGLVMDHLPEAHCDADRFSSPCLSCPDQPCLSVCPVNAFASETYDVEGCMDYLGNNEQSACRREARAARRACPYEPDFQYQSGHARFHMNAFLESQP
jgi:Fe-S-cluster-containing hydrogenase component 2